MVQQHKLDEAAFRGERFAQWQGKLLKGLNDLLNITQPQIIEEIHTQYLEAGADIIETNTFNAQSTSLAEYGMGVARVRNGQIGQRNAPGALSGEKSEKAQLGRICLVAGAIGPTAKMSSISTDVNDPGARGTTYDELVVAYTEQINGMLDGGADVLLVETIFDTLNSKAAFFAIQQVFEERGISALPTGRAFPPNGSPKKIRSRSRFGHLHPGPAATAGDWPDRRSVLGFYFPSAALERRAELRSRAQRIASAC